MDNNTNSSEKNNTPENKNAPLIPTDPAPPLPDVKSGLTIEIPENRYSGEDSPDDVPPPPVPRENVNFEYETTPRKKSLGEIIALIHIFDTKNKYSIVISPKMTRILNELLSIEGYFEDVENTMNDIIKDDKINASDVPNIIFLLDNLYKTFSDATLEFDDALFGDLLKTLFTIAINEKIIVTHENDQLLLRQIHAIIDSTIVLMNSHALKNITQSTCSKLFTCFKKC